jgi:peroxiredoxin-like protein
VAADRRRQVSDRHVYRTSISWTGERKGTSKVQGLPELPVATPPQFPGGHEGIWSPEHLLVAAVESCIMTTFLAIAANSKLEFTQYSSRAEGVLEKTEAGFAFTEVTVMPRVVVPLEASVDKTRRIVEKSEKACLISRSLKVSVKVEPEVVVG